MNKNQKRLIVIMILIIVGMMLYPPFQIERSNRRVFNEGYGFILNPPNRATVNVSMLLVQWCGVLMVGGLAFYLFKDDPNRRVDSSAQSRGENSSSASKALTNDDNHLTRDAKNRRKPKSEVDELIERLTKAK